MVVGFLVGEARAEFVEQASRWLDRIGDPAGPLGGYTDQPISHVAQAIFRLRLAGLPRCTAQSIELNAVAFSAIAGQQVDVLDGEVQFGIAAILQFQGVVRRALHVEGLEALITRDPVIDVHHQIARGQRRRLRQEVGRPATLAGPGQPVTQNVGFRDHRQVIGLKAVIQRQDDPLRGLGIRSARCVPVGCKRQGLQAMIGQHVH